MKYFASAIYFLTLWSCTTNSLVSSPLDSSLPYHQLSLLDVKIKTPDGLKPLWFGTTLSDFTKNFKESNFPYIFYIGIKEEFEFPDGIYIAQFEKDNFGISFKFYSRRSDNIPGQSTLQDIVIFPRTKDSTFVFAADFTTVTPAAALGELVIKTVDDDKNLKIYYLFPNRKNPKGLITTFFMENGTLLQWTSLESLETINAKALLDYIKTNPPSIVSDNAFPHYW